MRQMNESRLLLPPDQHRWGPTLRRWHDVETRAARGAVGAYMTLRPFEVWRSRDFLVQMFRDGDWVRMTVNRTPNRDGDWIDGITWDDLQRLKAEVGRGNQWAVEVYPAEDEIVNNANMRHLWLLAEAPPFAWTQDATQRTKG